MWLLWSWTKKHNNRLNPGKIYSSASIAYKFRGVKERLQWKSPCFACLQTKVVAVRPAQAPIFSEWQQKTKEVQTRAREVEQHTSTLDSRYLFSWTNTRKYPTKPRRKTTSKIGHSRRRTVSGAVFRKGLKWQPNLLEFSQQSPAKIAVRNDMPFVISLSKRSKHLTATSIRSDCLKPRPDFFHVGRSNPSHRSRFPWRFTWEGPTHPTGPDFHGDGQGTRHDTSETPRWSKEFLASKGCVFVWFKIEESDV